MSKYPPSIPSRSVESISIPSERIPPVAHETASGSKTAGGLLMFLFLIISIAMVGVLVEDEDTPHGSAERAGQIVGKLLGAGLFAGLPALFGFRALRNAARAKRAADAARATPTISFVLSGKLLIAADHAGSPLPDLSFKINGNARRMLLALPRAAVVDRQSS
jgi:hypothetical protein